MLERVGCRVKAAKCIGRCRDVGGCDGGSANSYGVSGTTHVASGGSGTITERIGAGGGRYRDGLALQLFEIERHVGVGDLWLGRHKLGHLWLGGHCGWWFEVQRFGMLIKVDGGFLTHGGQQRFGGVLWLGRGHLGRRWRSDQRRRAGCETSGCRRSDLLGICKSGCGGTLRGGDLVWQCDASGLCLGEDEVFGSGPSLLSPRDQAKHGEKVTRAETEWGAFKEGKYLEFVGHRHAAFLAEVAQGILLIDEIWLTAGSGLDAAKAREIDEVLLRREGRGVEKRSARIEQGYCRRRS